MSIILDGSAGITFPNSTTQASAGQVLQVVNASYGTIVNTASASWSDTGLSASITPKFSTSKVLVLVNCVGLSKTAANTYMGMRLLRGASVISLFETQAGYTGGSVYASWGGDGISYLDSPATTSSTTYKIQFNNAAATGLVNMNDGTSLNGSTITLMEIAS